MRPLTSCDSWDYSPGYHGDGRGINRGVARESIALFLRLNFMAVGYARWATLSFAHGQFWPTVERIVRFIAGDDLTGGVAMLDMIKKLKKV